MFLLSWSGVMARIVLREVTGSSTWHAFHWVDSRIAGVILAVVFVGLMLRFAHLNHRSADQSIARTGVQLATTAAFISVAGSILTVLV